MRPVSTSASALNALESAPEVVTTEWLQRRCQISNRRATDAIKLAVRRGILTWFERGKYHVAGV